MCYTYHMVRKIHVDKPGLPPEIYLLDVISGKWTILVIYTLSTETMRHSELQRAIGNISQKVLTQTLRMLERHGLVVRTSYPVVPPQVEYALTPLGRSLLVRVLSNECEWAKENYREVEKARETYDRQNV